MIKIEVFELQQKQGLPLHSKIQMSETRIREFYNHCDGKVYVAFSGGKDSTVLLDLVRNIYHDVPAIFVDTGLEYPEIKDFVKSVDNVEWIRPTINFKKVIEKYGYPVVSKKVSRFVEDVRNANGQNDKTKNLRLTGYNSSGDYCPSMRLPNKWIKLIDAPFNVSPRCCDVMKKTPIYNYCRRTGRSGFVGTMASDSLQRKKQYLRNGCNILKEDNKGLSHPLAFWRTEDIWNYIRTKNIFYSKIYDMGVSNTGCMFCMFGVHLEGEPNRFQCMKYTHPKLWDYCIHKLGCGKVMDFIGVNYGNMDLNDYIN